jgi:hypothetical protein
MNRSLSAEELAISKLCSSSLAMLSLFLQHLCHLLTHRRQLLNALLSYRLGDRGSDGLG